MSNDDIVSKMHALVEAKHSGRLGETGRKAERKAAKRQGARQTPASGAVEGIKGDFGTADVLTENKSTIGSTITLHLDALLKIKNQAMQSGRLPALAFQFTHSDGRARQGGAWVAVPEWVWNELVDGGRVSEVRDGEEEG